MLVLTSMIISLIVLFIHATTWEGHINQWVKKYIPPKGMVYKPIYGCPLCMTPWWGSLIYWLFFYIGPYDMLISVMAASGFSALAVVFISIKDSIKKMSEK